MDNLRSAKERCFQLWHQKKNRLEQNLQLRLFEQDCDRVNKLIHSRRHFHFLYLFKVMCMDWK
jgi:hypothetical protein